MESLEVFALLAMEGVIIKKGHSELLKYLAGYFPIGSAEVGAKLLAAGQEQLVRNDVGEGP